MESTREYAAHLKKNGDVQSIREHSLGTAALAESFSAGTGLEDMVYDISILHDVGKYQPSFQRRLYEGSQCPVDHSTCGAIEAGKYFAFPAAVMMRYCIAGHHSHLPDGGCSTDPAGVSTVYGRCRKKLENYSVYRQELELRPIDPVILGRQVAGGCTTPEEVIDHYAFLTRFCFSCLVDADWLDTERFFTGHLRERLASNLPACLEKAVNYRESFVCATELQKARGRLQEQAIRNARQEADVYLMDMPTGSGKTLCSVICALEMAVRERKRVIYICPYNSIINQTADRLCALFGENAQILRDQSCYDPEEDGEMNEHRRVLLGQTVENWDADLIVTTQVQFFESIYSSRRTKLRKLHHLRDCILIFDEVQQLPLEKLRPCIEAVGELVRNFGCRALFLTATMPDFRALIERYLPRGIRVLDLVSDRRDFSLFVHCHFAYIGESTPESILEQVRHNASSLVVVNARSTAQSLFQACGMKHRYHLSTWMIGRDRSRVIGEISRDLESLRLDFPEGEVPEERRIVVFSTSMIEAGVDLDFHAAYRELAGLDSILQTAGRCNREGRQREAFTFVFTLPQTNLQDVRKALTRPLLKTLPDQESIRTYYDQIWKLYGQEMDSAVIGRMCSGLDSIPFARYEFRMIGEESADIFVAEDEESAKLLGRLKDGTIDLSGWRKLRKYALSVSGMQLRTLLERGEIEALGGAWVLKGQFYDQRCGLLMGRKE